MPIDNIFRRVLLLEDEPIICKVLARTLKADGMEVDIACNGLIAKEKIDAGNKYDIFIFDIRTPIISGNQLFEYLETKYPEFINKVVFTTGDCLNTTTAAFLERVKRPFVMKPYAPEQIKSLITQVLKLELSPV
jgi:DNA-binding NtrC family response regulator